MKNTRIYVAAMAVAMLFVTSCKKEESSVKQEFSATMEVSKSGEKTNLVNDHLQWAHGSDKVSITCIRTSTSGDSYFTRTFTAKRHSAYPNNLSYANLDLDEGQTPFAEGEEGVTYRYRSIYPASISGENNTQVTLPKVQASTSGELTGYPMYAESSNKSLQFWNLCSVLKLSLTGSERISKIEVMTDKYINGTFTINYQNDNQPLSPTTVTNHTKMTTLTMSTPVQLSSEASYFYIYLPVQQYKYIKINFYNEDNLVYTKAATISSGVTLERSRYHLIEFSTPAFKPSVLCGEFTVAPASGNTPARKVSFSKGNLLYVNSTTYKFADHQYYHKEGSNPSYSTWLYHWGTVYHGFNIFNPDPPTMTQQWLASGVTISNGSGSTWRCLSQEEWDFLLVGRSVNNIIKYYNKNRELITTSTYPRAFTLATITANNNSYKGMIIFPDVFYWPLDNKEPTVFAQACSNYNFNLTDDEWKILEGAGCVFLPATGFKYGYNSVSNESSQGNYWSSSYFDYSTAYILRFSNSATSAFTDNSTAALEEDYCAFRLVKNN